MDMNLGELQGMVKDRETGMLQSMGSQSVGHDSVLNVFKAIEIPPDLYLLPRVKIVVYQDSFI